MKQTFSILVILFILFSIKSNAQTILLQNSPGNPTATTVATPTSSPVFVLEFKIQNNDTLPFHVNVITGVLCCGSQSFISKAYLTDTTNTLIDSTSTFNASGVLNITCTDSIVPGVYKKYRIKVILTGILVNQFFGASITGISGMLNGSPTTVSNTIFGNQFQTSGPACTATLSSVNVPTNQYIYLGTPDTLSSAQIVTNVCGTTAINLNVKIDSSSTALTTDFTNVNVYFGATLVASNITLSSSMWNLIMLNQPLAGNDTVRITITGNISQFAIPGSTIKIRTRISTVDSVYGFNVLSPEVICQTEIIKGMLLKVSKDTTVANGTVTPGLNQLFAKYKVEVMGNTGGQFTSVYSIVNNTGSCLNPYLQNVHLNKVGAGTISNTLPIMGTNSVLLFTDTLVSGTYYYEIRGNVDSNAVDSSTIIVDLNTIWNTPIGGFILPSDSIGQTMTIDNPTTPIGGGGPCTMIVNEHPTSQLLYKGQNVCLTAFKVQASNCSLNLNSAQLEIFGSAFYGDITNLEIKQNNNTTVGTQGVMSFNQTIPLSATVAANQVDTFYIWGNLDPNALTDNRTYEPKITLSATDSLGNPKTVILTMATKWVKDAPTTVANIDGKTISFYPNPATDYVTITGYNGMFRITDMSDREIIKGSVSENTTIDVHNYPKGMYFIKTKNYSAKFIKQ